LVWRSCGKKFQRSESEIKSTMIAHSVSLIVFIGLIYSQQLSPTEHAALMSVFAGFNNNCFFRPPYVNGTCTPFPINSDPACGYSAATCDGGRVVALDLQVTEGALASSVGLLTGLTQLQLTTFADGNITLPTEIGLLSRLTSIHVVPHYQTTQPVILPNELGDMAALERLTVYGRWSAINPVSCRRFRQGLGDRNRSYPSPCTASAPVSCRRSLAIWPS
jgi:hypothetical protein